MTTINLGPLNDMIANDPMLRELFKDYQTTSPNYRYYSDKRTRDMYFWTTEKITPSMASFLIIFGRLGGYSKSRPFCICCIIKV